MESESSLIEMAPSKKATGSKTSSRRRRPPSDFCPFLTPSVFDLNLAWCARQDRKQEDVRVNPLDSKQSWLNMSHWGSGDSTP